MTDSTESAESDTGQRDHAAAHRDEQHTAARVTKLHAAAVEHERQQRRRVLVLRAALIEDLESEVMRKTLNIIVTRSGPHVTVLRGGHIRRYNPTPASLARCKFLVRKTLNHATDTSA